MNTAINITIRDRVPYINEGEGVITYNSDYVIEFDFDNEWSENVKTVYFAFEDGTYKAVVIDGTTCAVPTFDNSHKRVFVGVQAGDIRTTRPCCLKILDSIADYVSEAIPDPSEDVYQQIINLINAIPTPSWDTLENKPFTSIGSGLKVEDGTLTATAQGGTDITITDTAEVGEVLTVEEVDSEGKPTKWKTEKPTAEQKQADWSQTDTTDASYIKNKPTIPDVSGKVDIAQGVDKSGEYLAVGSDGNVTTVDAPSSGSEQVQSDWYEFDSTSAAYIKNKPFSDTVTDITGRVSGTYWTPRDSANLGEGIYIFFIDDDVNTVNSGVDSTNITTVLAKYNLTGSWNSKSKKYQITGATDDLAKIKKLYKVESSTTIPWNNLPTSYTRTGKAIFCADQITDTTNQSPCTFYAWGDGRNQLYVPDEIKSFTTFDFGANALVVMDKLKICFSTEVGTASEVLGLTVDDFPVMSYCISVSYSSNRPSVTYYIETATNKRFKATYTYGKTAWTSVVNLNSDSSEVESPMIAFEYNGEDVFCYDMWNNVAVDEATFKTTLSETPWKIWFASEDGQVIPLTKRDYDNNKLYFADYANNIWYIISNIGTDSDVTYTPTYATEPMSTDVMYTEQTLTDAQKTQARTNIGAGTSSFSGSYTDLTSKPAIPDVPEWAMADTKPTYTASEVGAVATAQGTANSGKYLAVGTDGNVVTVDAPSGGEGEYELIQTVTLTEDTTELVLTQESDGTAYDFSRMKVTFRTPFVSSGYVNVYFANEDSNTTLRAYVRLNDSSASGRIAYCAAEAYKECGRWRARKWELLNGYSTVNTSNVSNVVETAPSYYEQIVADDTIKYLRIVGNSSWSMPSGTIINIWGVRA